MPLDIDHTRRFDTPERLVALIRAVLVAHETDEKVWLEWKGPLDLSVSAGQFNLARQILGFANRMPDVAAPWAEGHAYVVVGAEPGGTPGGMAPTDPAVLENRLRAWVGPGSQGPRWHGSYVTVDGGSVLVVEVDVPRWGDPIYPLRKEHERASAGSVLVRHAGSVEPATPADMDALSARAGRRTTPTVAVDVGLAAGAVPLGTLEMSEEVMEEWLDARRVQLLRCVQPKPPPIEPTARRTAESFQSLVMRIEQQRSLIPNFLEEPDERTEEQYRAQVDRHIEACRKALAQAAADALRKRELAPLKLRVLNLTDTNLPGLEVSVHFPGRVTAGYGSLAKMPDRPWPFGKPRSRSIAGIGIPEFARPVRPGGGGASFQSPRIENGGSVKITYPPVDLRPRQELELPAVHLGIAPDPAGRLVGSWSATSTAADGVAEGIVEVELEHEPLSLWDLLPEP